MRLLAEVDSETLGVLVGVIIALVGAAIAWLVFHLIAPAYESVAAIATFLVLLLVLFLL